MNHTNPFIQLALLAAICELETHRNCPDCGMPDSLDSGTGFGMRDLECSNWDEDDDELGGCCFSFSYPAETYFALISD